MALTHPAIAAVTQEATNMTCGIQSVSFNGTVAVRGNGEPVAVLCWDGFHRLHAPIHRMTETDAMARALYFERRGQKDRADEVLEMYLQGRHI
jgi:hypothetical protein